MIGDDLYAFLSGNGALTAVFTGGIHREIAAQGASMPFLTFTLIGSPGEYDLSGIDAWQSVRVQFDVVADSAAARDNAVSTLDAQLNHYSGALGGLTARDTVRENLVDLTDVDGDLRRWRTSVDYTFWYE